jgi:hypothetical protein
MDHSSANNDHTLSRLFDPLKVSPQMVIGRSSDTINQEFCDLPCAAQIWHAISQRFIIAKYWRGKLSLVTAL